MKSFSLCLPILLLVGCTLPEKGYHAIQVSKLRADAIPVAGVANALQIRTAGTNSVSISVDTPVLVLGRVAAQGVKQWTYFNSITPEQRQLVEVALQQGLLFKGYGTATRLNILPVEEELAFPFGIITAEQLKKFTKPPFMLIITITKFQTRAEDYSWRGFVVNESYRRPIGTRASVHISIELLDAGTSRTLCLTAGSLETLIQGKVESFALLEIIVRRLMQEIPEARREFAEGDSRSQITVGFGR